jgi:hypothetical protein
MTDQQIAIVTSILSANRLCVGWQDPAGPLRRIFSVETRGGEPAGVFENGQWCALRAVVAEDVVVYFRPFADEA